MGWKGIAFGGCVGGLFGGPLGALLGAAFGHQVERRLNGGGSSARRSASFRLYRDLSAARRARIFCACAAAMLAKMAKADGRISREEIAGVEQAFARLGFTAAARDYAIGVFRKAKDDAHTIDQYAEEFAAAVDSVEVRELFYEILWDITRADGTVSAAERAILRRIPRALRIRADWYAFFAQAGAGRGGDGARRPVGGVCRPGRVGRRLGRGTQAEIPGAREEEPPGRPAGAGIAGGTGREGDRAHGPHQCRVDDGARGPWPLTRAAGRRLWKN